MRREKAEKEMNQAKIMYLREVGVEKRNAYECTIIRVNVYFYGELHWILYVSETMSFYKLGLYANKTIQLDHFKKKYIDTY